MSSRSPLLLLVLAAIPAAAQDPAVETEPRVMVHGYLSQAFAASDGYQILGIPKDGTVDYRTAALQVRTAISPKDSFVIQFSQERLGESPAMKARNEVDLDWIFYERQLPGGLSARVGRVELPFGIYNEIRYVGPLLPFFRAADVFYGEASYTFDSLNGAVLSKKFLTGRRFSLDADVYGGEWSFVQNDNTTVARAKKGLGAQVWLNTPVSGLRFGLSGRRSTVSNILHRPAGYKATHRKWAASMDGNFSRIRLNAEFEKNHLQGGFSDAGYVLASWHLNDKLSLTAQASRSHLKLDPPFRYDGEISRDLALGLSYSVRRNVLLKLENHWARGRNFEEPGITLFTPPLKGRYAIVSLSTYF